MSSRMDKYEKSSIEGMSRVSRNQDLYKSISKSEIENYEVKSNATILGESNKNQIDVDQVKKILDTRYNDMPKRRSIKIEKNVDEEPIKEEITKEYDINAVLEKARSGKASKYDEERAKKLRDTQYDILNNLTLPEDKEKIEEEKEPKETETRLLDLINTITINEDKSKKRQIEDSLDLLSDLKGDDNTEVFEGMKEEIEEELKKETSTISLDNTAFSKSIEFNKKDFEDFDEDSETGSVIGKVIIGVILIIFLVVVFFFIKAIFNF